MPQATAAAIITAMREGKLCILLTRRAHNPFQGEWCLPGGHIELYEKVRDAAIREVKEETGLDFKAQFFGCFDEIIPERQIHAVVCVYSGEGNGEIRIQEGEVTEYQWFPLENALHLRLAFDHHSILAAYASGGRVGAEKSPVGA